MIKESKEILPPLLIYS